MIELISNICKLISISDFIGHPQLSQILAMPNQQTKCQILIWDWLVGSLYIQGACLIEKYIEIRLVLNNLLSSRYIRINTW